MRDSRGLLILLAVVVVVAGIVWWLTRPQPETVVPVVHQEGPVRFDYSDRPVDSPDLEVSNAEVRGSYLSGVTSWSVTMTCEEDRGCVGKLVLEVEYASGNDDGRVLIVDRVDLPTGGELRFQGIEDPGLQVGVIRKITLEVLDRRPPPPSDTMEFD